MPSTVGVPLLLVCALSVAVLAKPVPFDPVQRENPACNLEADPADLMDQESKDRTWKEAVDSGRAALQKQGTERQCVVDAVLYQSFQMNGGIKNALATASGTMDPSSDYDVVVFSPSADSILSGFNKMIFNTYGMLASEKFDSNMYVALWSWPSTVFSEIPFKTCYKERGDNLFVINIEDEEDRITDSKEQNKFSSAKISAFLTDPQFAKFRRMALRNVFQAQKAAVRTLLEAGRTLYTTTVQKPCSQDNRQAYEAEMTKIYGNEHNIQMCTEDNVPAVRMDSPVARTPVVHILARAVYAQLRKGANQMECSALKTLMSELSTFHDEGYYTAGAVNEVVLGEQDKRDVSYLTVAEVFDSFSDNVGDFFKEYKLSEETPTTIDELVVDASKYLMRIFRTGNALVDFIKSKDTTGIFDKVAIKRFLRTMDKTRRVAKTIRTKVRGKQDVADRQKILQREISTEVDVSFLKTTLGQLAMVEKSGQVAVTVLKKPDAFKAIANIFGSVANLYFTISDEARATLRPLASSD